MVTILLFFLILLLLVLVHEAGHFIAAKISKMRVDEFAFGFPPRLFSRKIGETEYSMNSIPLGGYVKIFGENGDEDKSVDLSRAFSRQPKYKQIFVLIAGVTMNWLLAWVLLSTTFIWGATTSNNTYISRDKLQNTKVLVSSVLPGSPAELVGLKELDEIVSVKTDFDSLTKVSSENIPKYIQDHQENIIQIEYTRDNETIIANITPTAGFVSDKKVIGIGTADIGTLKLAPVPAFVYGAKMTYEYTKLTFVGFYDLVLKLLHGKGSEAAKGLTGPVGIVGLVGDARTEGLSALLGFIALISINLAVLNILPLPALDGGRIVIVVLETIRRKNISFKAQNIVNGASFVLLLGLMLIVTVRDVLHLIK